MNEVKLTLLKNKAKFLVAGILIIVALCGFLVYKYFIKKPVPSEGTFRHIPTLQGTKRALLSRAKLSFIQVAGQEEKVDLYLSFSQLPKELIPFIKTEARDAKFQKVSYSDGKQGFLVEYKLTGVTLEKIYGEFAELAISEGWQPLYGAMAGLFAFLELEDPIYQLRISQSLNDDESITITIEVMVK